MPDDIRSPVGGEEYRNTRAFIVFFIVVSGVFVLAGVGAALGGGPPQDTIVGMMYGVGGAGGVLGLIATLRGNRRRYRLAYLMAIGFPGGTFLAVYLHVLRVEYLGHLDEQRRGAGRPPARSPNFTSGCGRWRDSRNSYALFPPVASPPECRRPDVLRARSCAHFRGAGSAIDVRPRRYRQGQRSFLISPPGLGRNSMPGTVFELRRR